MSKIYHFENYYPVSDDSNFIAPGAVLTGDAVLESDVNIWFNSVVRADVNKISIGEGSNIQDLSMLHVTEQSALVIGKHSSIGHGANLHGCIIGDHCLIGIGAIVLDKALIPDFCIVAAGSVVSPGKKFESYSMIMGTPARAVRSLRDSEIAMLKVHAKKYVEYALRTRQSLR